MQEFFTVKDVAMMAGLSERTIRNYLKDGLLTGKKVGVQWRFTKEDVESLFRDGEVNKRITEEAWEKATAFIKKVPAAETSLLLINEAVQDQRELEQSLEELTQYLSQYKDFWFSFQYFEEQKAGQFILAGATQVVEKFLEKRPLRRATD